MGAAPAGGDGVSMLLMVQAMKAKVGNSARKLVLLKLADNANDQGECWPSYQYIADQCEMSKRSAINHIEALCEMGIVSKESRKGPKGNSTNVYIINLGGEISAPPSANSAPPIANSAPPPSANSAPGISHSFESVNEPVTKDTRSIAKKTATNQASKKADPFDELWLHYPKREGSNPKNRAKQNFNARLKEGYTVEVMAAGLKRYIDFCKTKGQTGTGFVMQAQRFFGTALEFLNDWEVSPEQQGKPSGGMIDPSDTSWIHDEWGY